jgi:hypothetical protein
MSNLHFDNEQGIPRYGNYETNGYRHDLDVLT